MNNTSQVAFGQLGSKLISGTAEITPDSGKVFVAITALTDFVVSAITPEASRIADLDGQTIPAGTTIYGRYTSITGTADDVAIAYMG